MKRTKYIDENEKVICFFWPFLLIEVFSFPLVEQDMYCNNEALLSPHWHVTSPRLKKTAKETLTNLILTLNYHFHSIQRKHSNDMQRVGSLHHNIFSQMFAVCFDSIKNVWSSMFKCTIDYMQQSLDAGYQQSTYETYEIVAMRALQFHCMYTKMVNVIPSR